MPGFSGGLYFGGTEALEPIGKDDLIADGIDLNGGTDDDDDEGDEQQAYENPKTGERTLKRTASPSSIVEQASKRGRTKGGKAAIPKRVVADYDSDDGRIVSLKQQGYTDEYVAQRMIQEGRMRYVPRTVSSRWLRLRNALQRAEDEKLDDELSDWHVGEDDKLTTSIGLIEKKFEVEMQRVIDRKWKDISGHLGETLHRKKYTAKACRERWEAVQNGTALLPIELDPDKEGRKDMREARISEAKRFRAERAAEVQRVEAEKKARAEERKLEATEQDRIRTLSKHEKDVTKAEEERVKKEKRDHNEKQKEARKAAVKQAKLQSDWEKKVRETEAALFKKITGNRMPGIPRTSKRRTATKRRAGRRSRDDDREHGGDDQDSEEPSDKDAAETGEDESEDDDKGNSDLDAGTHDKSNDGRSGRGGGGGISAKTNPAKASKIPTAITNPPVTEQTLLNSRSILTNDELDTMLFNRKLPRRGGHESHPQVVARLAAADVGLSTPELDDLLRKFWDKGKGSKIAKIQRLQTHEAGASTAGQDGTKATDLGFKKRYEGYRGEYASLLEDEDKEMMD
ncbi:hypothetical protein LTR08_001328 [Meristemomyces frigidus]|nr:hypothetical protein LTR08_001328 [Meristemomyces frigidus]